MRKIEDIRHKIAILSGKGGVGKTVVTVNLASALKKNGYEVCIFDAGFHAPAVPKALGCTAGWTWQANTITPAITISALIPSCRPTG